MSREPATKLIDEYPVIIETPVAWGDMDAFGHVNNAMYFRYFESARIAYFERMGVVETDGATGIGPILASTSCRFKAPLTYPDTIHVGAKVVDTGSDRFTMQYGVWSVGLGRIAAEGQGLVVVFDYGAATKAALPPAWRERIEELERSSSA